MVLYAVYYLLLLLANLYSLCVIGISIALLLHSCVIVCLLYPAQPHWVHHADVIAFDADYSPPTASFRSKPQKKRTAALGQSETFADLKASLAAASKLGGGPLGAWVDSYGCLYTHKAFNSVYLALCVPVGAFMPIPSIALMLTPKY